MKDAKEAQKYISSIENQRTRREVEWRKLSRWLCPWRGRFDETCADRRERASERDLFTYAGSQAVLRSASGMTSGMTPRNAAWFKPGFVDESLLELEGVRPWLDRTDTAIRDCLSEGGFYQAIQNFNLDLVWAGCALLYCETSQGRNIMDFSCPQVGTYTIATDSLGRLQVVARRLRYSVQEAAQLFGEEALSEKSRARLKSKPLDIITVWHLVKRKNPAEITDGGFTHDSLYWEEGAKDFLRQSGYYDMPFFFTRWNDGATWYGTGPGDLCVADAMQLDELERRKLDGLAKLINPPVIVPAGLKDTIRLEPGGINYLASRETVTTILDLAPYAGSMQPLMAEIQNVARRIENGLMASVFNSMPLDQRPAGMSATEFLERKREALQQLGPVISAYEPNVLTPLLFRVLTTLDREQILEPKPESLRNTNIFMKMSFISPMANALRQNGVETARALFADVTQMFQATRREEIFDKLDLDQMIDELATSLGVPGSIVRSDEDIANLRRQRSMQAMQAQAQEAARSIPARSLSGGAMQDAQDGTAPGLQA